MPNEPPQPLNFWYIARSMREDEKVVEQVHGSLETMVERVKDDAILNTSFADSNKFRLLMKRLLKEVNRYPSTPEKAEALPAGLTPARLQALVDEWQSARSEFHAEYRKHKDYLEKLALRIVP